MEGGPPEEGDVSSSLRKTTRGLEDGAFFGDERIIDVHVRRLRKKLETEPSQPRVLVTVRGLGYRLDVQ